MSPEQTGRMNRALDYRTDLYSLGATFYHLLTGQMPFQAEDALEIVHYHLAKMPTPPGEIIDDSQCTMHHAPLSILSDIIMKLLAKNAEDRYQSAYGLKYDLETLLESGSSVECPVSGFIPAQHDVSEYFQIPQKLYGRKHELQTLLLAFDRIAHPQSTGHNYHSSIEMLLVTGQAGIGKSSLINEIHKPIVEQRGYFISGKFDQFKRNIPYSALIQGFQSFVRQLLSEPQDRLDLWKENLLNALRPNGQVIIEVIPEIELIIGTQGKVPELPPTQSRNRFNFVFRNFVRTCAAAEHPLVIFLDDLQWADIPSLQLLELIMTDPDTRFIIIIGAYRNNEVSDIHPFMLKLADIRKAGVAINTMTLNPLELLHINRLLTDTLHATLDVCTPLAELLLRKTEGNPFFLRQFLQALYEDGLLVFDMKGGTWTWDFDEIRKREITENVVELMAGKIQKLSEATQHVLKLAACIGSQFDLYTLSIVREQSAAATMRNLHEALQEELIIPLDDSYKYIPDKEQKAQGTGQDFPSWEGQGWVNSSFKFLHDRVHQAAYSLIGEEHKQSIHLQIGQLLFSETPETEREEKIFEIVNHLNIGKDLITSQSQRDALAELNLVAGQKAKASVAYQAAFTYLQGGIHLLEKNSWKRQYELTLALYTTAAEAAYLYGDFEQMEQLIQIVLQYARTLLEKEKVYEVKLHASIAQNKLVEAVQTAILVLKLLGVTFPAKPNKFHIWLGFITTKIALTGKPIEDLLTLPEMTDPYKLAAMRIMSLVGSAYFAAPELLPLIICKGVKLSIEYGNAPVSAYIYAGYGLILCGVVGDIEAGYRFGQLSLGLLERFHAKEFKAKTLFMVNTFIRHWKEHVKETLPLLLEAYHIGRETGDLEYAALSIHIHTCYANFMGKTLTEVAQEMDVSAELIGQLGQETARNYHQIERQAVLNLIGKASDPCRLVGEAYDEEVMLPLHLQANDRTALFSVYSLKLVLCYVFQAYLPAVENADLTERYLDGGTGMLDIPRFHFYDSLARLAVFSEATKAEQRRILRKVMSNQKKMKKWAYHAPMNYLHKFYLVEAERARVLGKDTDAMAYYDKAIEGAKEHEYLHEEALTNEAAARFYLASSKEKIARTYMREACYCYRRWGANAKVQQLERTYPELFTITYDTIDMGRTDRLLERTEMATTTSIIPDTTRTRSERLDLTTVLKAAQTLSGEIQLSRLLATMLRMMIENAGAEQGVFIQCHENQFLIQGEGKGETVSNLLQTQPVEHSEKAPISIINYVARSTQPFICENAATDMRYANDRYIQTHQPKSVACVPVVSKGEVTAIIYLENNLTTGVFTPDRVEILKLLSSQAAISLENAMLYETLEQKVKARTFALEQEIAERKRAEDAARAANEAKSVFLTNMSHELRTPLNAILGYTQLLKGEKAFTMKQHHAIDTVHQSGEHLLMLINDLLDLSRIEAGKMELDSTYFHLPGALKSVVEITKIRAQQKGIAFIAELSPELPSGVYGDERRLRQILLNLLNNAIKFTDRGHVTFRVLTSTGSGFKHSNTHILHFEVSDTGPGIPPEHLENIFLSFYQGENMRARREGTGLGLAISRQLARMMKSELHVTSTVGQGSIFQFDLELPVIADYHPENPSLSERRIIGFRRRGSDSQTATRKILVVDDHAENRIMLRDILAPLGFEILEAGDGREAIKLAQAAVPDLILMDVVMPEMEGFEAVRQIWQIPALKGVIVIGISASTSEATEQESVAAGCHDFLGKPIRINELFERLRCHLELEWIYEDFNNSPGESSEESEAFPLIAPPREVLLKLLEFANAGYITDIREVIATMKTSDSSLLPFAARIEHFTDRFQFDQLIEFIKSSLQEAESRETSSKQSHPTHKKYGVE